MRLRVGLLGALLLMTLTPGVAAASVGTGAALVGAPRAAYVEPASRQGTEPARRHRSASAYRTAFDYVVTFYPRWLTFYQSRLAPHNQLIGPDRISPIYQAVVAINVDTLYASTVVDASDQPVIVTVPRTRGTYSILQLDGYGQVFPGIPNGQPGTFALTGPGWTGTLPPGVVRVRVPYDVTELIVRADRYSASGQDTQSSAERFRRHLRIAPLSDYLLDPTTGATSIVAEAAFAVPIKTIVDRLVTRRPIVFLASLRRAVLSPTTQPKTRREQRLSDRFDVFFSHPRRYRQLAAGAQAAHSALIKNYLRHTIAGSTWVRFLNIGDWDATFQGYLDRSSIAEFLQYGNNRTAAAYFHAFRQGNGRPLDGRHRYVLRFGPDELPQVSRFWSLTAYTPRSIELVRNRADKNAVAGYTPGLVTGRDGSVTILMSRKRPAHFPEANWLPVPRGRFNVMLRAYGPQGTALDGSYVPPPIQRVSRRHNPGR
jgi:hypothetical protein